jgi:hypothetical protein
VATRMGDRGVQPHVIEAVLNHVSGHKRGVAGIYNRSTYASEKRAALETWATPSCNATRPGGRRERGRAAASTCHSVSSSRIAGFKAFEQRSCTPQDGSRRG